MLQRLERMTLRPVLRFLVASILLMVLALTMGVGAGNYAADAMFLIGIVSTYAALIVIWSISMARFKRRILGGR